MRGCSRAIWSSRNTLTAYRTRNPGNHDGGWLVLSQPFNDRLGDQSRRDGLYLTPTTHLGAAVISVSRTSGSSILRFARFSRCFRRARWVPALP